MPHLHFCYYPIFPASSERLREIIASPDSDLAKEYSTRVFPLSSRDLIWRVGRIGRVLAKPETKPGQNRGAPGLAGPFALLLKASEGPNMVR